MSSDGSGVKPQKGTLHMLRKILMIALVLAAIVAPLATRIPGVDASSHREAPLISQDPLADNTDVYAFVSPDRRSASLSPPAA